MKAILALAIIILSIAGTQLHDKKDTAIAVEPKKELPSVIFDCDTYAHKLFCLTNDNREQNGKTKLNYSLELEKVSQAKSKHMCENNYFSHDYNGESWTKFIKQSGIDYAVAGENLAKGYSTPEDAMTALMNSPKHYENIMDDYTYIGIYTEECGGKMFTTQTFAKL